VRIVIALGGNALIRRGEPADARVQEQNVARAAAAIASVSRRNQIVVTHGNGPQIGLLALLDASAPRAQRSTLDVLGAETDGMIGYLLQRELMNALGHSQVVTLLTQVEVDRSDPAFTRPTKFIGPVYSESEARQLAATRGWSIAADGGHWRRVVPSPEPRRIVEGAAIEHLVAAGFVAVCVGGGGIPVAREPTGSLIGVECVIDKDRSSALLAESLGADCLLMLTDVDAVYAGWRTPNEAPIRVATPDAMARHSFPAGSMGPKVEAACRFVTRTGQRAYIGALDRVAQILEGTSGTLLTTSAEDPAAVNSGGSLSESATRQAG
jgi:carbamate kinase